MNQILSTDDSWTLPVASKTISDWDAGLPTVQIPLCAMLNTLRLQYLYLNTTFAFDDIPVAVTGHSAGFRDAAVIATGVSNMSELK